MEKWTSSLIDIIIHICLRELYYALCPPAASHIKRIRPTICQTFFNRKTSYKWCKNMIACSKTIYFSRRISVGMFSELNTFQKARNGVINQIYPIYELTHKHHTPSSLPLSLCVYLFVKKTTIASTPAWNTKTPAVKVAAHGNPNRFVAVPPISGPMAPPR